MLRQNAGMRARSLSPWIAAAADIAVLVVFVVIGRRTHHSGSYGAGFFRVLWPFAVGLGAGWAISKSWRDPLSFGRAIVAWAITVCLGVALRVGVEGNAFRPSFTVVAFVFIGAGMLGWRAVVVAVRSTRERRDAGSRGSVRQR